MKSNCFIQELSKHWNHFSSDFKHQISKVIAG